MTEPGDRRRAAVARRAADLATVVGLEGLSIGGLASDLGMSKSGVAGLFGSKEGLQVAAAESAEALAEDRVLGVGGEHGVERLRNLLHAWLDYLDEFPGGCFFLASAPEFADRPGPVRDALRDGTRAMRDALRDEIALAQRLGELDPEADPVQISFELFAMITAANHVQRTFHDPAAAGRARTGIEGVLARYATPDP